MSFCSNFNIHIYIVTLFVAQYIDALKKYFHTMLFIVVFDILYNSDILIYLF